MLCSCSKCNRLKGSNLLEDWYNPSYKFFDEERLVKIKHWIEQKNSIKIQYVTNELTIGYAS